MIKFFLLAALFISPICAANSLSFKKETTRATSLLKCSHPIIAPASEGQGALYSCVAGSAETVKFFINENEKTGHVENIKLIWNDGFTKSGYGLHADQNQAQAFVKTFSQLYAPQLERKLISAFFSNAPAHFNTENYFIEYTYSRGSEVDERLLILTPKAIKTAKETSIQNTSNEFTFCKNAVSKAIGYSAVHLSGNGEPIQGSNYKSFMLTGKNKDFFFCEVHSIDHRYKIKATHNGKPPFNYIAEGKL